MLARVLVERSAAAFGGRWPPDPVAEQLDRGRHHDRPDDEGVQQDPERDHETEVEREGDGERHQDREGAGEDHAGGGNDRAGRRERPERPLTGAVIAGLLAHARHQEDRVVDPERDEEDEGEGRDRSVEPGVADDEADEQDREPERAQERKDHARDQHERRDDRAQQQGEDDPDHQQRQGRDQPQVTLGRLVEVVGDRAAADQFRVELDCSHLAPRREVGEPHEAAVAAGIDIGFGLLAEHAAQRRQLSFFETRGSVHRLALLQLLGRLLVLGLARRRDVVVLRRMERDLVIEFRRLAIRQLPRRSGEVFRSLFLISFLRFSRMASSISTIRFGSFFSIGASRYS